MPNKIENFEKKLRAIDELVIKSDFENFIKLILNFTSALKKQNTEVLGNLKTAFSDYTEKVKSLSKDEIEKAKQLVMKNYLFVSEKIKKEQEVLKNELDSKLVEIKAECLPDNDLIAKQALNLALGELKALIPTIEAIEQDLPKLGAFIRDGLELLQGDERLKIEAINGLREELDELKQMRGKTLGGGGFSLMAMQQHLLPWTETTVAPNGVLTDFVIGHTPNPTNSLEVMVDNSPLFVTSDWTYATATKTISFLIAPPDGSKIRYKCII